MNHRKSPLFNEICQFPCAIIDFHCYPILEMIFTDSLNKLDSAGRFYNHRNLWNSSPLGPQCQCQTKLVPFSLVPIQSSVSHLVRDLSECSNRYFSKMNFCLPGREFQDSLFFSIPASSPANILNIWHFAIIFCFVNGNCFLPRPHKI